MDKLSGPERLARMAAAAANEPFHPLLVNWSDWCVACTAAPGIAEPDRHGGVEMWPPIKGPDRVLGWATAAHLEAIEASIVGGCEDLRGAIVAALDCPVVRPWPKWIVGKGGDGA